MPDSNRASIYEKAEELECLVVLLLNTRKRIRGHSLISIGTHDTILVSTSSVFRCAVACPAAGLILAHNHPSGDPTPSEADIKVTRDLIRAGQILKIEVVDHIVIGRGEKPYVSLRECGYCAV
jgi:DNA repair protein RadC